MKTVGLLNDSVGCVAHQITFLQYKAENSSSKDSFKNKMGAGYSLQNTYYMLASLNT